MIRVQAIQAAKSARDWLMSRADARILHVFDRVLNLSYQDSRILSIVTSKEDMGPFSFLVVQEFPGFRDVVSCDDRVRITEDLLSIGSLKVDIERIEVWDARPEWGKIREGGHYFRLILPELQEVIKHFRQERLKTSMPKDVPDILGDDGSGRQVYLARELISGDTDRIRVVLKNILGCGQGLTPSGDDFLLGVLLAGYILLPYPGLDRLCELVQEELPGRTTMLSTAWLEAAAEGECSYVWHELFTATKNRQKEAIRQAARKIAGKGHTSGVEALSGFCAAAQIAAARPRRAGE